MKNTVLLLSAFYCLFICSCKKKKDAPPASRLPASFTGMKEWRDADQPTSTYRYHFSVKTSGKDDVIIDSIYRLTYQSTDSSTTGYIIKYEGGPPWPAAGGYTSASFIHNNSGDTIYYMVEGESIGRPPEKITYVTP